MTTSRDILVAMATGQRPRHALVALGYAGWGAGQLEREIGENAWLSVTSTPEILFHTPVRTTLGGGGEADRHRLRPALQ